MISNQFNLSNIFCLIDLPSRHCNSIKVLNWICHHRRQFNSNFKYFCSPPAPTVQLFTDSLLFPLLPFIHFALLIFDFQFHSSSLFPFRLLAYNVESLHFFDRYCWRWVNKIKLLKCFVCASDCLLMMLIADDDTKTLPMKRFNSSNSVWYEYRRLNVLHGVVWLINFT